MDTSRYADLFLTESREHLSAINHSLLELERNAGGAEPISALFRAVHTVKGMSATMGYTPVAELSHELETLLDRVRRGAQLVTPAIMDALFASADALETAIELAVAGRSGDADVTSLVARLREVGLPDESPRAAETSEASSSAAASSDTAWTAAEPVGAGLLVRVRLQPETPLKGVRAFLVVQRARSLGEVTAVSPRVDDLQNDAFGDDFAFRIVAACSEAELLRELRAAGDVAEVSVGATSDASPIAPPLSASVPAPNASPVPREPIGGAPPGDGAAADAGASRQQRHVRIDLRRLDVLMNLIGELVITRGRLTALAGGLANPALDETVTQASRLISDLQDQIMTSRMVPVWQVFDRFPRLVRDAARSLGKQVDFTIEGKEIELDRSMLDEIGDPIVHLLRNSVDHGIEMPDARTAAGKEPAGRLTLSAVRDRSAVLVKVTDDGRGIDRERVLKRAQDLGLVEATRDELTDEELLRLVSRPGFSTAERVTDISGRGVGIDAVQNRVRTLGGSVEIRSVPGKGTAVTVRLPLTLAIVRALLSRVGDETYALAMTHVSETVQLSAAALRTVRGKDVFVLRGEVLPLLRLRDLVGLPRADDRGAQIVVLEMSERRAGLVIDELTGQQEIVVKQFDAVRSGLSLFSGATILSDGAPALIIDVGSLL